MESSHDGSFELGQPCGLPGIASLAALRAWYSGMSAATAVAQYLSAEDGRAPRAQISAIRRQIETHARQCRRDDLAKTVMHSSVGRVKQVNAVMVAIEQLRDLQVPLPLVTDPIERWFPERLSAPMKAHGWRTLADLMVHVPRRRRWWTAVSGLGAIGARQVEAFFALHPRLTDAARALVPKAAPASVTPLERLYVPDQVDGSLGAYRAPRETCILGAKNDHEAVQAWLSLHESSATQRAYRKEAERLILWAIVERRKALSSLTTEDAVAYRAFLRQPSPRARWVGPTTARSSVEWRPFAGPLSARSIAYALSVVGALFRWLIEQRYCLANPFAGIKVRGASAAAPNALQRAFGEGEWAVIQAVAEGLEWVHGWQPAAAQRLRFVLDFSYATGLRIGELVSARLGDVEQDSLGDYWLKLVGKGGKIGKVALPTLARTALDHYLMQRALPTSRIHQDPKTAFIGSLRIDSAKGITATRLWRIMRRFFRKAAEVIGIDNPALAEKLGRASPHWMRHTHATHALARGAELTTVRDNLRHASITTTSIYLHGEEVKRARQMDEAFKPRNA